jgi:ADP-ribose pyrophosphatase
VTAPRATLPELLKVELEIVGESRAGEGGFLALRRTDLIAVHAGQRSATFTYDTVDRRAFDASIMVAHHRQDGRAHVWLRSCVRPPLVLRRHDAGPGPLTAVLWEVAAGLIEPGESPRSAAARELAEELGFHVPEAALAELGAPMYPAPALIGEVHHFFHVEVDRASRQEPHGDGSPLELDATVVSIPLDEALAACRRGEIRDEKTELALRRLADVLA